MQLIIVKTCVIMLMAPPWRCRVLSHNGIWAVGLSTMGRASLPEKGGDAMQITYAELFQFCPVIIGLCMQAKKK